MFTFNLFRVAGIGLGRLILGIPSGPPIKGNLYLYSTEG